MCDSVFVRSGDHFLPNPIAHSPWGPGVLHGGPPSGLLARAIELSRPSPDLFVSRITIDLFRPVPASPLSVETRVVRAGRRIHVVEAGLMSEGTEVARASALMLLPSDVVLPEGERWQPDSMPAPGPLPVTGLGMMRDTERVVRPGFHTAVEVRRAMGGPGSGRHASWIRIPVPLVEGEELTPFVRVASTADFGNALGNLQALNNTGFINADVSLHLHRLPVGEWICLDSRSMHESHGLGVIESRVHDEDGPVGVIVQALLANRRT